MRCSRTCILFSAFVLAAVCELCIAQGYYGYNPYYSYYPYYRRPTTTQQTKRTPSATSASSANRLSNNYLRNPYASVSPNSKRSQGGAINSLPDIYRRRPVATATTTTTQRPATRYRVSKADAENAKFVGASNQEASDESGKTLQLLNRRRRPYGNRCSVFGRQSDQSTRTSTAPKEQGRFLWDLNVYNIYGGGAPVGGGGGIFSDPVQTSSYGCGGLGGGLLGGGGGGGGLLSDPYYDGYGPAAPPLNNFLSLFAPGILQNALAATARPPPLSLPPQSDTTGTGDLQSDPAVDPNYGQSTLPVRRPAAVPNRIYYDTAGASPVTPAQLIGGVATTVNGIIQQLTGNLQPVYPGYG